VMAKMRSLEGRMWLTHPTYACPNDSPQPCSRAPGTHLRCRREPDGLFTGELTSPIEPRWSAAGPVIRIDRNYMKFNNKHLFHDQVQSTRER